MLSDFSSVLIASGLGVALTSGLIGFTLEMVWPASAVSARSRMLDLWFTAFGLIVTHAAGPLIFAWTALVLGHLGAGLIPLANDGWGLVWSAALYLLAFDFLRYWIHRLEHAVPALWAMHSLHHSATEVSAFTGYRRFWLSGIVQGLITVPVMTLLFQASPNALLIFSIATVLNGALSHANVRMRFGRFTLVYVGPQFHRIHHSTERNHWDRNFAQALPVWDVIFGTAWVPARDEWPETGVAGAPHDHPIDAMVWPLRFLRVTSRGKPQSEA